MPGVSGPMRAAVPGDGHRGGHGERLRQAGDAVPQQGGVGVPGARPHADDRLHPAVVEEHHLLVDALCHRLEERPELRGEALLLALVDAEQTERGDQLPEVARGRGHRQQRALGPQHPAHLRGVARGEEVDHQHRGAAPDRQRPPDVAEHRAGARMRTGGAPQRVA